MDSYGNIWSKKKNSFYFIYVNIKNDFLFLFSSNSKKNIFFVSIFYINFWKQKKIENVNKRSLNLLFLTYIQPWFSPKLIFKKKRHIFH